MPGRRGLRQTILTKARADMIRNEQIKLTATFINGLAVATFAVGGLAPMFSTVYGNNSVTWTLLALCGICFLSALGLHMVARGVLKGLDHDPD